MTIYDLSQPVTADIPCNFSAEDKRPVLSFEEGDSHGISFITSRLDNLYSNTCTHVDFPGHLADVRLPAYATVGEAPIETFVGKAAVLDVSSRFSDFAERWFDRDGLLDRSNFTRFEVFIDDFSALQVQVDDLLALADAIGCGLSDLDGLILHTSLDRFWVQHSFESWEYIYFYGPYFSDEACDLILSSGIRFVAVDCFQVEHPITNLAGDELPLMTNAAARSRHSEVIKSWRSHTNHHALLGNGVLIYENLTIPGELLGCTGLFVGQPLNLRLPDLNDNALVRPLFIT